VAGRGLQATELPIDETTSFASQRKESHTILLLKTARMLKTTKLPTITKKQLLKN